MYFTALLSRRHRAAAARRIVDTDRDDVDPDVAGGQRTWSVTVFTAAGDQPMKNLRLADKWTNTIRACPLHAHWLDGEPITDILPMSGVVDRYRRFAGGDAAVVTGFVAVADAWACTNPSAGRGLTVGFPARARVARRAPRSAR